MTPKKAGDDKAPPAKATKDNAGPIDKADAVARSKSAPQHDLKKLQPPDDPKEAAEMRAKLTEKIDVLTFDFN